MIWQVTMPVWVALVFIVAFAALAIAGNLLYIRERKNRMQMTEHLCDQCDKIGEERDEAREQRDKLNRENESLHQGLRAARDERATLKLQLAEATKPKERTPRTKKAKVEP